MAPQSRPLLFSFTGEHCDSIIRANDRQRRCSSRRGRDGATMCSAGASIEVKSCAFVFNPPPLVNSFKVFPVMVWLQRKFVCEFTNSRDTEKHLNV